MKVEHKVDVDVRKKAALLSAELHGLKNEREEEDEEVDFEEFEEQLTQHDTAIEDAQQEVRHASDYRQ